MDNFRITYGFRAVQLYFQIFLAVIVPLCIAYTVYSRSLEDWLTYGGAVAVFMFELPVVWVLIWRIQKTVEHGLKLSLPPLKPMAIWIAGAAILSMPLGAVYYSLGVVVVDAWGNLRNWEVLIAQRPFALAAGTIAVVTAGLLFFWFRLRARFIYGVTETLAGIAFAVHRLSRESSLALPSDDAFYFAMLTAGVYLIVRGLDNMHQAWRDQTDPLARVLFRLGTQSELVELQPRRLRSSRLVKVKRRSKSPPSS